MKCTFCRNRLSDYIDGTLSSQLRAIVEAHIENCPACRSYAESMQNVVSGLRSLRVERTDLNVWSDIQHRLAPTPARHWQGYLMRPLALLPACAVALLLVIALLLPITRSFDQTAPGLTPAEFHQYMGVHARLSAPTVLSDPDVRFVSTELQYMSPSDGSAPR
jgi:anti-sigma factor RsiW